MHERAKLSYECVVLCEDIRLEFDGKRTLVGVYTADTINVPSLPYSGNFALFATGLVSVEGEFQGSLRVENDAGQILFDERAPSSVLLKTGRFSQNLIVHMEIKEEGRLKFTFSDVDVPLAAVEHHIAYRPFPQAPL